MSDPGEDDIVLQYNWDNKLRHAQKCSATIDVKYDPDGNRIWKNSSVIGERKYIVDIVGGLPVILMELNGSSIEKTYIYANSQIIAQHTGEPSAINQYFFLHDRLGSVRLVMEPDGDVKNRYIYEPFGDLYENSVDFEEEVPACGSFRFTGQYFDSEIEQYYLRARQYYPYIGRFTSRDLVFGQFEDTLTLHRYLYCKNNPLNFVDPAGLWTFHITGSGMASFGWSGVRQSGIVIDDDGNIGWMNTTGIGVGTPGASLGVSIGLTNADTIYDLVGVGASVGGSYTAGLMIGVDLLFGTQRNGALLFGIEATGGASVPSFIPAEIHTHVTHTTVYDSGLNYRRWAKRMEDTLEEAIFRSETVGEAYGLLFIWAMLPF